MAVSKTTVQLVVIGAGPGGYAAAFYAADLGLQVMLIDTEKNPGGVCLYRGCIPSKALLHVAKIKNEAKHANVCGLEFAEPKIDLEKMRAWKETVITKLTSGLGQLAKARKVNFVQGRASFLDAKTLKVIHQSGNEDHVTFQHCIIATGSRPTSIPGLNLDSPRLLNSTTALALGEIPKKFLVIGGGYIGLELGSVYAALGSQVTVVEMTDGLIPGADRDLATILQKHISSKFESLRLKTRVGAVRERPGEPSLLDVSFIDEHDKTSEATFDQVLVAVGRKPNSSGIGLNNTQIQVNERGFIVVDEKRQTTVGGIYAIGDVAGDPMLAHKASHEARVAVEAVMGHRVTFEPKAIPAVIFTDPEVAWCGLTETEAKKQNRDVKVVKFPWAASGRALTLDRTEGMTKLIIDPKTETLLGVGLVGSSAGEMIAEAVVAIEMGASVTDLKLCIHPHPTLSETLMEAAELYFGHCTHINKKR